MDFSPMTIIVAIFFVWSSVLSYFLFRIYRGFSKALSDGKKESLFSLIEEVLKHEQNNRKNLDQVMELYDKLKSDGDLHIQKIGLVRFNPFKETGGDQSFVLALVDAEDTGVIISSLHTRTGTRWYAKNVVKGVGKEYELSDDERKALRGARRLSE